MQHAGRCAAHADDVDQPGQFLPETAVEYLARRLGDLFRFIADAFEVGDGFAHRHNHAQVDGGRLPPGDEVGTGIIDGDFHLVDAAVAGDDPLGLIAFAFGERLYGALDLFLDQTAHAGEVGTDGVEFRIELLEKMCVHGLSKTAGDVILGALVAWLDEDFVGVAELDQFAKVHVGGEV